MILEDEYKIENLSKPLFDIDIIEHGTWIGVTGFSDDNQRLIWNNKEVFLPERLRFPSVRIIDENTALVVIARTPQRNKNGWLIDSSGEVKSNFFAGDAIQDIVVTKDFIVMTYFDESFGSSGIEGERLAIFDLEGNYLYGYMSEFSSEAVDVFDCYAATLVEDNQIIFFPYTEFPLVLFDVENKTQQVWTPPKIVAGSNAITKLGNKIYFHSPYEDKTGIYEWQIGSEEAEQVASYSSCLRGLPKGKFFAKGDSGYTIISLQ
jgi:hypothetical protein